jgi:phage gp36-like protein
MAYCSRQDIIAEINAADIIPFLDDDNDGFEDPGLLDSIINRESAKVDGRIASIYQVPISPTPPLLRDFCTIFVCEALYRRRLTPDEKNPFHIEAEEDREILTQIGNGKLELDVNVSRAFTQGAVVTAPIVMNTNSR